MSRKSPGEGSVYQRSDGVWCAALQMEGKRRIIYGKSEREARAKLLSLQKEAGRSGTLANSGSKTVADLLDLWLSTAEPTLKPRTAADYAARCNRHIRPVLGRVRLTKLSPERIQTLYSALMKRGLTREATYAHALLHRACHLGVLWGWLPFNPCDRVVRPRHQAQRKDLWSADELRRFLDGTEGRWLHPFWIVAATTGCRLSELAAIKWQDVDMVAGVVEIRRSLHRIGGKWVESTPKTRAGERTISLPSGAVAALKHQRAQQAEWRLKSGQLWQDNGLVFTNDHGSPLHQAYVQHTMQRECINQGLPKLTPHGLRHLSASLLLGSGIPVPAVAQRLGHASPNITMSIYAHALQHQDRMAADAMEDVLRSH